MMFRIEAGDLAAIEPTFFAGKARRHSSARRSGLGNVK